MHISARIKSNPDYNVTVTASRAQAKSSDHHPQILRNISTVKNTPDSLIGKTINPHFASRTMDQVSYDGHGKILSFKENLSPKLYNQLAANVITDLANTPTRSTTAIRTPQECLIKIATIIQKSSLPDITKQDVLSDIKDIFLSGNIKNSSIKMVYDSVRPLISGNDSLQKEIKDAVHSLERQFNITKHNDNYYGRTFETDLAQAIVDSPSAETINNTELIKNVIINDFSTLNDAQKNGFCQRMHKELLHDPATWRAEITEVKNFLQKGSAENYLSMVNSDSKLKHLLIMHLAVKVVISSPGFIPLMKNLSGVYTGVIKPQRQFEKTLNSDLIKSGRTGIQLHYQVREPSTQKVTGERPIDRYRPQVNGMTEHNRLALTAEKAIGVGMSGSSNVLNSLFEAIEYKTADFNMDHARLFTAAFLTHSGGHSFNEAYTVFNYQENQSFEPLAYASLSQQNAYASRVVDAAYEKLLATAMSL